MILVWPLDKENSNSRKEDCHDRNQSDKDATNDNDDGAMHVTNKWLQLKWSKKAERWVGGLYRSHQLTSQHKADSLYVWKKNVSFANTNSQHLL